VFSPRLFASAGALSEKPVPIRFSPGQVGPTWYSRFTIERRLVLRCWLVLPNTLVLSQKICNLNGFLRRIPMSCSAGRLEEW